MNESQRRNMTAAELDIYDFKKNVKERGVGVRPAIIEELWNRIPVDRKDHGIQRERGPPKPPPRPMDEEHDDSEIPPRPDDVAAKKIVTFDPSAAYPKDPFTVAWHKFNGRMRALDDVLIAEPPNETLVGTLEDWDLRLYGPRELAPRDESAAEDQGAAGEGVEEDVQPPQRGNAVQQPQNIPRGGVDEANMDPNDLPDYEDEPNFVQQNPIFELREWRNQLNGRYIRERPASPSWLVRWDILKNRPPKRRPKSRGKDRQEIRIYRHPTNFITIFRGRFDYERTRKYKPYTNWAAISLFYQLKTHQAWMKPISLRPELQLLPWCTIIEDYDEDNPNFWRVTAEHEWDDTVMGTFEFDEEDKSWKVTKENPKETKSNQWTLYKSGEHANLRVWVVSGSGQWFELLDQETSELRSGLQHVKDVMGMAKGTWTHVRTFTDRYRFGYVALFQCVDGNNRIVDRVIFKHLTDDEFPDQELTRHKQCWDAAPDYVIPLRGWSKRDADHHQGSTRMYIEYATFGTLDGLMQTYDRLERYMPEVMVWRIFHNIMRACVAMENAGLVHVDLKPNNVFIMEAKPGDGNYPAYPRPVIGDFGMMFGIQDRIDQPAGTTGWQAPEMVRFMYSQAMMIQWVGTHVYVAGLIVWAVMRKRRGGYLVFRGPEEHQPYPGANDEHPFFPSDDPKLYSSRLEDLASRCLAVPHGERPTTQAVMQEIEAALESLELRIPRLRDRTSDELPEWELVDVGDPFRQDSDDEDDEDGRQRPGDDDDNNDSDDGNNSDGNGGRKRKKLPQDKRPGIVRKEKRAKKRRQDKGKQAVRQGPSQHVEEPVRPRRLRRLVVDESDD